MEYRNSKTAWNLQLLYCIYSWRNHRLAFFRVRKENLVADDDQGISSYLPARQPWHQFRSPPIQVEASNIDNFYGVNGGRETHIGWNLESMTTSVSGPMGSSKHDLFFSQVKQSSKCVEWMAKHVGVRPFRFGHIIYYIDSQLGSWNGLNIRDIPVASEYDVCNATYHNLTQAHEKSSFNSRDLK